MRMKGPEISVIENPSNEKIKEAIGWTTKVSIEDGLLHCLKDNLQKIKI